MSASIWKSRDFCQVLVCVGRKVDSGVVKFVRIDAETKRKQSDKIKRRFSSLIKTHGFERTKPTYWIRYTDDLVEFIHIHLFTFTTAFRIHFGIRVLNVDLDFVCLNGPDSDKYLDYRRANSLLLEFNRLEDSIDKCANEIYDFVVNIGEPWFIDYRSLDKLFSEKSILTDDEKLSLKFAKLGNGNMAVINKSLKLLGIKNY